MTSVADRRILRESKRASKPINEQGKQRQIVDADATGAYFVSARRPLSTSAEVLCNLLPPAVAINGHRTQRVVGNGF